MIYIYIYIHTQCDYFYMDKTSFHIPQDSNSARKKRKNRLSGTDRSSVPAGAWNGWKIHRKTVEKLVSHCKTTGKWRFRAMKIIDVHIFQQSMFDYQRGMFFGTKSDSI